ncbi:hypothetical protein ILUMI_02855 [Ignelater luminosus]|uniref:VASt domain-containing protein n=1 Tax=Ignelater luminosus TaxID=2038154 RepID=A0A8K0GKH0_IGNLU|nr:hypothetical protein ILUMI_02855 [Ignelater luminosus]
MDVEMVNSETHLKMNHSQNETASENTKSTSPNTSPRSSPRPSPRPQTKREHCRSDTHLTVNYKDQLTTNFHKHDSSPGQESNASSRSSNLESIPGDINTTGGNSNKDKKEGRSTEKTKKKSSWYNALYPTYKSKSEDFKRIFKDVPDDERLVVDYSCALQKEILVHGRLYASQNFLCFYANIFRWETNVTIKWKEVSAITKEKTALVIPNAILICTKNEKYFFTSFAARDKTFLMLFRVWQNALLDKPMANQEMWQWVHQCYGEELGLTSDDDDYIPPGTEDEKLSAPISVESFTEECTNISAGDLGTTEHSLMEDKHDNENQHTLNHSDNRSIVPDNQLPTDMSDTTESDAERNNKFQKSASCTAPHEGRQVMNEVIPMHVDQLFTLLFTSSKFFLDFHASRKTTDLTQTAWTHNPEDNTKTRVVNLTVALNQPVGPKTSQVTETQVMLPCSKAGSLYAINLESVNAGIPYADSFYLLTHYCIQKISETQTSLVVYAEIKYKKSVWGLVKGFIEKNCWQGMEDFYKSLSKALYAESEEAIPAVKRKSRRRRRCQSIQRQEIEITHSTIGALSNVKVSGGGIFSSDLATLIVFGVLILLVILNVMLYYKLWLLEETPPYTLLDLHILKDPPKSHDEWIKLLQKQETLHTIEMQRWQKVLKTSINLLKQIEESLNELQHSIHPTYTNKIMSIIQNHKDTISKAQEEL